MLNGSIVSPAYPPTPPERRKSRRFFLATGGKRTTMTRWLTNPLGIALIVVMTACAGWAQDTSQAPPAEQQPAPQYPPSGQYPYPQTQAPPRNQYPGPGQYPPAQNQYPPQPQNQYPQPQQSQAPYPQYPQGIHRRSIRLQRCSALSNWISSSGLLHSILTACWLKFWPRRRLATRFPMQQDGPMLINI